MTLYLMQGAIEEGFIYAFVALGLFISYKILKIADMTTDGTFVLGAAVSSRFIMNGNPFLGLIFAILAGMFAGLITAFLQTKLKIQSILAGIITMTGLYSVNLFVQGGLPNLFYNNEKTIFSMGKNLFGNYSVLIILLFVCIITAAVLIYFFATQIGLSVRATGDNNKMIEASSINPFYTISVGLAMSNGLVALSGALLSQKTTQGDINIGTGVVVMGLASIVIGTSIFRSSKIYVGIIGAIIGSIIYRLIFTIAIKYTSDVGYLKIVTAAILTVFISYPMIKSNISQRKELTKRNKRNGRSRNA